MIFDVFTPILRLTPPKDGGFRQKTADLRLRFAATSIFVFLLPEAKKVALRPPTPGRQASEHTPRVNSKASELTSRVNSKANKHTLPGPRQKSK